MKAYEKVAVDFAQALVDAEWESARQLLTPALQQQWPTQELAAKFRSMSVDYAEGPATSVHFDPEFSTETWPSRQPTDVGWAYVSIQGDGFVEAVTVTVAASDKSLKIRVIEWGRP